ncbi:MAG: stretch-activated cation channel mid1, partial [Lichina confinis]
MSVMSSSKLTAALLAGVWILLAGLIVQDASFARAGDLFLVHPPDGHGGLLRHNAPEERRPLGETPQPQPQPQPEGSRIHRRADDGVTALANNIPANINIQTGETQQWVVSRDVVLGPHASRASGLPSSIERRSETDEPDIEDAAALAADTDVFDDLDVAPEHDGVEDERTVYISVTACIQPSALDSDDTRDPPPQLQLFVSQSTDNAEPGPDQPAARQQRIDLVEGWASAKVKPNGGDVYIGIAAPNNEGYTGMYNYEIAASIDAMYHSFDDRSTRLHLVDSDATSAILVTDPLTNALSDFPTHQAWLSLASSPSAGPLTVFVHPASDSAKTTGLQRSFCGLQNHAQFVSSTSAVGARQGKVMDGWQVTMTARGVTNTPKQEFWVNDLNASASYWGILARRGNSSAEGAGVVGGGGKVWGGMEFNSKADNSCRLISNLTFCSSLTYAVPANPDSSASSASSSNRNGNPNANADPFSFAPSFQASSIAPSDVNLARFYDDLAAARYKNFSYALAQIPCETTSSARYSLASTCEDCAAAYKDWVCAVTIPRCDDYSSPKPFLKARNIGGEVPFLPRSSSSSSSSSSSATTGENSSTALYPDTSFPKRLISSPTNTSRTPLVDAVLRPAPYKELLPCLDLCHRLARVCPSALRFTCPVQGSFAARQSYGERVWPAGDEDYDDDDEDKASYHRGEYFAQDNDDDDDDDDDNDDGEESQLKQKNMQNERDRWSGHLKCNYPGALAID